MAVLTTSVRGEEVGLKTMMEDGPWTMDDEPGIEDGEPATMDDG